MISLESNTDRSVKISAGILKTPNKIFVIKSQNLKQGEKVKIEEVLIIVMNQNFSKSEFYKNHLNWSIFNWGGGVKNFVVQIRGGGGGEFWTLQKFTFPTIIIFVIF